MLPYQSYLYFVYFTSLFIVLFFFWFLWMFVEYTYPTADKLNQSASCIGRNFTPHTQSRKCKRFSQSACFIGWGCSQSGANLEWNSGTTWDLSRKVGKGGCSSCKLSMNFDTCSRTWKRSVKYLLVGQTKADQCYLHAVNLWRSTKNSLLT